MLNKQSLYIGIKSISALPMTRLQYNEYRGFELPSDENGFDEGYLVEYQDGGVSNHPKHKGYISWSPKDVFDHSYKLNGSLGFAEALSEALKEDGVRIARSGWNGAGLYIYLHSKDEVMEPFMVIYNPKTQKKNTWVPSSADLIANDWLLL